LYRLDLDRSAAIARIDPPPSVFQAAATRGRLISGKTEAIGKATLLGHLRRRLDNDPAYHKVAAQLNAYLAIFDARGPAQRRLFADHAPEVLTAIESMRIYSDLPADEARRMVFTRILTTMGGGKYTAAMSAAALGSSLSYARTNARCIKPGHQASLEMRTPFLREDGHIVRPTILSLSAPDLGGEQQPEWPHYVDPAGRLRAAPYRHAIETLWGHIDKSSARHPQHRVVLSAFGMMNFLNGLKPEERARAQTIGAEVFARRIRRLRQTGVEVVFTALDDNDPFWSKVNERLSTAPLTCMGPLPGRWLRSRDLLVNAWDPESLVGNGCKIDNSMDGWVGRGSLVHESHAMACMLYKSDALKRIAHIQTV
jgi:hypothetical protein